MCKIGEKIFQNIETEKHFLNIWKMCLLRLFTSKLLLATKIRSQSINKGNLSTYLSTSYSTKKKNFFKKQNNLKLFIKKCKLCIVWNWFITKIIWIAQKYLRLFKMAVNQSFPGLNKGTSSNIRWLSSTSQVKFQKNVWCTSYCLVHEQYLSYLLNNPSIRKMYLLRS